MLYCYIADVAGLRRRNIEQRTQLWCSTRLSIFLARGALNDGTIEQKEDVPRG
uniref:Uncharacterized protein n=1 Tax=Physcomitrium patens TaxID=3218 RepID=A0A2K1L306_PHYPA|nr:hypothetical protein PHYPA_003203 [Physcomitrium patens]